MSKKRYNLIAYKQISGNRNNVLVLLYTFNTSVWSDGLQGRFTRWNLCSFRCQRQYIRVCLVCVLPVCPCRGECGRGRVGEVLDVTIRLFLLLVRQLRTKTKLSESKYIFLKKQSDLQNIWTFAVNHTQMSTNGFSERHQTFILSLFSSLSCEVMHYENTLSPHTLSWMSFVPLPKMDERPLQPCVTNSRCPL